MSDAKQAAFWAMHFLQPDKAAVETEKRLIAEKRAADAEMAYRLANLAMPADIRSRARAWGMEAFCEVLWNNAFQAGYREAMRNREERK